MHSKFEVIRQLMDELADEMEYSAEDFEHRIPGRKKPQGVVIEMQSEGPDELEMEDELADGASFEEPEEDMFKKRLMKLRG